MQLQFLEENFKNNLNSLRNFLSFREATGFQKSPKQKLLIFKQSDFHPVLVSKGLIPRSSKEGS
jgi:hypothetical protein